MRRDAFAKHIGRKSHRRRQSSDVLLEGVRLPDQPPGGFRRSRLGLHAFAPRVERHRPRNRPQDRRPSRPTVPIRNWSICGSSIFWWRHAIAQRLEAAESRPFSPLRAEATVLRLVADVLDSVFVKHGQLPGCAKHHHRRPRRSHGGSQALPRPPASMVSPVPCTPRPFISPAFSSGRPASSASLPGPFTPWKLPAMAGRGADDLAAVALELGFSRHSPFADTFRRELGCTPSGVRRKAGHHLFRKLSKNLEV